MVIGPTDFVMTHRPSFALACSGLAAMTMFVASAALAGGGLGTITLRAKETREFSVRAAKLTILGWRSDELTQARVVRCPEELCIELKKLGDQEQSVQSPFGGALTFPKSEELVRLAIINRADFPIQLEVYQE